METKKKIDDEVRELGGGESQSRSHGTVIQRKRKEREEEERFERRLQEQQKK